MSNKRNLEKYQERKKTREFTKSDIDFFSNYNSKTPAEMWEELQDEIEEDYWTRNEMAIYYLEAQKRTLFKPRKKLILVLKNIRDKKLLDEKLYKNCNKGVIMQDKKDYYKDVIKEIKRFRSLEMTDFEAEMYDRYKDHIENGYR